MRVIEVFKPASPAVSTGRVVQNLLLFTMTRGYIFAADHGAKIRAFEEDWHFSVVSRFCQRSSAIKPAVVRD